MDLNALMEALVNVLADRVAERIGKKLSPTPAASDRLLTVEEAASFLGDLSRWTVYKRKREGEIPYVKDGNRLFFKESDLRAYVEGKRFTQEKIEAVASRVSMSSLRGV